MTAYTFSQLIDFTRTTSATYVNASGLITTTPASVNLLTYTQALATTPWESSAQGTAVLPTATNNAGTAPDGTGTATRLQLSLAGGTTTGDIGRRRQMITFTAVQYTFSVWIRSTDGLSNFNIHLQDPAGATQNIAVTGSWTRYTVSGVGPAGTGYVSIGLRGGQTPANSNTADILVWGAQLELGSAASTYTKNVGGFFPPRFDYDPVTLAPKGLLIEEQRTNLMLRSIEFDNAAWSLVNATVTANTTTSPDGTTNADKLVENTVNSSHYLNQLGGTVGNTETSSIYAKAAGRTWLYMSAGSTLNGYFDLSAGVLGNISGGTATITPAGNGWYRCTITGVRSANNNTIYATASGNGVLGYTGDGTSGVFLYGAQLEAGSFATSYIPTVASTVTRTADTAIIAAPMFAPWFNQPAGTFVVEVGRFSSVPSTAIATLISATDNPLTNDWLFIIGDNVATTSNYTNAGATQANLYIATSISTGGKAAFAYTANDFAAVVNGGTVSTDSSGTLTTDLTALRIGSFAANPNFLNGHLRSINYYPLRLTNAQLQGLTT